MKVALITDAWTPQINGVVRTLQATRTELERLGHEVAVVSPDLFRSMPCPTYPEIRLAFATATGVGSHIARFAPDAIHIATEGPLGVAARAWCRSQGLAYTTAYHTQFPEYLAKRTKLPAAAFWPYIRWFHGRSRRVLVATDSIRQGLRGHGIEHVAHWGRGVDLMQFTPDAAPPPAYASLPRPIQLYVGRVAIEKNIEAFLGCDTPGAKVVVGDGPARRAFEARYPDVRFLGAMGGQALAGAYAGADVFVFPSRTDTFGLVMIEALACGTPVAAYPVPGPADIITDTVGALDNNLARAIAAALLCAPADCIAYGRSFGWDRSAIQFLENLSLVSDCRAGLMPAV
jgi:glycosyltransferase involved in cell wall biosynthesis